MSNPTFDKDGIDGYAGLARALWGATPAYREFEKRSPGRTPSEAMELQAQMMQIFAAFGTMRSGDPASEEAQRQVGKLQGFITEHFYTCTKEILSGLGQMYAAGGDMSANIDKAGGDGTASFAHEAISVYCGG